MATPLCPVVSDSMDNLRRGSSILESALIWEFILLAAQIQNWANSCFAQKRNMKNGLRTQSQTLVIIVDWFTDCVELHCNNCLEIATHDQMWQTDDL